MAACTLSGLPDSPPLATELPCNPEEIDRIGIIPYYKGGTHVHFSIHDEQYGGGESPAMPSPLTYFEPSVAEELEAMNVLW